MTKKEEVIEELIKDLNPKEQRKLRLFWKGKGELTGEDFSKYANLLEKFNKQMSSDDLLEEYLKESRRPY